MLGTKLGEMPITLRIHTPYANLLTDDFLEKHSGCLGAFGPSAAAAAFGRRRPPLRLDNIYTCHVEKMVGLLLSLVEV